MERPQRQGIAVVKAKLLEIGQQAGSQITPGVGAVLGKVENAVILAESVLVEIAVGIVEQNAFGVGLGNGLAAGGRDGLRESGRILEHETVRRQGFAALEPAGFLLAAQAPVAFIDQQQVVVAELRDGHGVLAPDVAQLGDFDDIHAPKFRRAQQIGTVTLRRKAVPIHLPQVLVGQRFVGRNQNGARKLILAVRDFGVMPELQDIGVHQ